MSSSIATNQTAPAEPSVSSQIRVTTQTKLMLVFAALLAGASLTAHAGNLIVQNTSEHELTCSVDNGTASDGTPSQRSLKIPAHDAVIVSPGAGNATPQSIGWITCNGVRARNLALSNSSSNRRLVFNGRQSRSLNATLYAFIPTLPGDDFSGLVAHVIEMYQKQNPGVLLNLGMDPNFEIYKFDALRNALTKDGTDVMEVDTLFMSFLAQNGLVNPASIKGQHPLPVALEGSTVNGQLWGVPSWMCTHFVYSFDPALKQVGTTFTGLVKFLQGLPKSTPALVGDYDGSWTIPSLYINAYEQAHGLASIPQAMGTPMDAATINNLLTLSSTCTLNGQNSCTNGTYHNGDPGATESAFATGGASGDEGFSEQSFFIRLKEPKKPLYIMPLAWAQSLPLLYNDTFVTSAANCAPKTPCASDAQAFTTLMTSTAMKNYIVMSSDLKPGSPWRTLLVSNANFWQQPIIQKDPLYSQFSVVLSNAKPFPNNFTDAIQQSLGSGICSALKAQQPSYNCKSSQPSSYQP